MPLICAAASACGRLVGERAKGFTGPPSGRLPGGGCLSATVFPMTLAGKELPTYAVLALDSATGASWRRFRTGLAYLCATGDRWRHAPVRR